MQPVFFLSTSIYRITTFLSFLILLYINVTLRVLNFILIVRANFAWNEMESKSLLITFLASGEGKFKNKTLFYNAIIN